MNYERLWKILEALMVELTGKGVNLPQEIINDLKSAKLYILTCKTNVAESNLVNEIELYMEKLESNLLYYAESEIGKDFADKWMKQIHNTRIEEPHEITSTTTGFITGLPKGEHWIRINLSGLIQIEDIHELLTTLNLSITPQKNDYILVHGKEEEIKTFVKRVSGKIGIRKK